MATNTLVHGCGLDSSSDKETDNIDHAERKSLNECADVLVEGGRAGWAAVAGVYVHSPTSSSRIVTVTTDSSSSFADLGASLFHNAV